MVQKRNTASKSNGQAANLGFEPTLWLAADKLRNNMDAGEYKHVVLGLIFLKYISDAFQEKYSELVAETQQGADPEDPDEYRACNIFWVPKEARWTLLQTNAKQPIIENRSTTQWWPSSETTAPRTSSAVYMNTSSPSSPPLRGRRAANSIPPIAW